MNGGFPNPRLVPHVVVDETKTSQWCHDGLWGKSWTTPAGSLVAIPNGRIILGEFSGAGAPGVYELRLSRRQMTNVPPAGGGWIYCDVSYGCGLAAHHVQFDWGFNGSSILLPGQTINVSAIQVGTINGPVTLSASIARWPGGKRFTPTWTTAGHAAGGGTWWIPTPERARGVMVFGDLNIGAFRVEAHEAAGLIPLATWDCPPFLELLQNGVYLPHQTSQIRLTGPGIEVVDRQVSFLLD